MADVDRSESWPHQDRRFAMEGHDDLERDRCRRGHRPRSVAEHYRFHRRIAVLGGNTELERILSDTLLKLQRYDRLQLVAGGGLECHVDHRTLAAAITSRDPAQARDAMRLHVAEAREALLSALLSSDTLMSADLSLNVNRRSGERAS